MYRLKICSRLNIVRSSASKMSPPSKCQQSASVSAFPKPLNCCYDDDQQRRPRRHRRRQHQHAVVSMPSPILLNLQLVRIRIIVLLVANIGSSIWDWDQRPTSTTTLMMLVSAQQPSLAQNDCRPQVHTFFGPCIGAECPPNCGTAVNQ